MNAKKNNKNSSARHLGCHPENEPLCRLEPNIME